MVITIKYVVQFKSVYNGLPSEWRTYEEHNSQEMAERGAAYLSTVNPNVRILRRTVTDAVHAEIIR